MMSLTASSAWAKTVAINKTNFPDAVFREYVLSNFDTNGDKKLTDAEAKKVKSLYLREEGIASLKGIEYFTALTSLNYRGGKLEHGGQLATLDVSKNTALLELIVECHQLTSLKVSGCTKLNVLHCGENRLTALDVSKNTALVYLDCRGNRLSALDVSKNKKLVQLKCGTNKLTKLDVSKNTALTRLECDSNKLTSLNVSKNTALAGLLCFNNKLTTLNIKGCTALTELTCHTNRLTALDVKGYAKLARLYCHSNNLTTLDVTGCTNLEELTCFGLRLSSLNVKGLANLRSLDCSDNMMTSINVTGCYRLNYLNCSDNLLTALNVSQCVALSALNCRSNLLTKIDVSNCGGFDGDSLIYDEGVNVVTNTKSKPTILTSTLYAAKDKMCELELIASGTSATWTATGLPSGLTCASSGKIKGTPTTTGTFTVTVTAKNSKGSVSKKITIKIGTAPAITTKSLSKATVGKSYSVTMKASGSTPMTWSVDDPPYGLILNESTGKITFMPTESGTGSVKITAANVYGSHTKEFSLQIAAASSSSASAKSTADTAVKAPSSSAVSEEAETSSESFDGNTSHSTGAKGNGTSSPELSAPTQTEGYIIAHTFETLSVDKAGLYDFDVELDEDTPEDWTLVWVANSSEPSDDDEIADFFNSEGTPIEVVPGDKKITVSVWLNPNREYDPAIAVKK